MKILIVSSTPWDNTNSFGNTFSNLFEYMEGIEIYNLACRYGISNNTVVKKAVQLTDKAVLKSIYKWRFDPCWEMQDSTAITEINQELSKSARKKRRTIFFIIRDMIWKLGCWKKSKTLNTFLEKVNPDIIYLPIYASPYMCDVQQFIIKKLGVPVVGHISDDVYGYPPNASLLSKWYRTRLRKKLRKLIKTCSYLEVFAQNMKEEYERIFNKHCYLIGKGVQIDDITSIKTSIPQSKPLHFTYTGNIGDDRYKSLVDIGKAINEAFGEDKAVLDIYSATSLTDEMKDAFNQYACVKFHGRINKEEVIKVQQEADFLVHVEGFSSMAIFSARMSFSTKIIDYMMMRKPILAFGPQEVNSIQVLKENQVGLTAISQEELREIMNNILADQVDYERLTENTKQYLLKNRNIIEIQKGIYQRINNLVRKMKVLQINAVYGFKSTGVIVKDIGNTLIHNGGEAYFAYQTTNEFVENGCLIGGKLGWKWHALYARISGKQAYASKLATKKFLKWVDKIQPDIVHFHNLHSNYIHLNTLCDYLAKKNIPVVITMHDCWYFTGKCSHYAAVKCDKWQTTCGNCPLNKAEQPSLFFDCTSKVLQDKTKHLLQLKNLTLVGCSNWIANEAKKSRLQSANIQVVYNGVDTAIFTPHHSEIKKELGIENEFVILGMVDKWYAQQNREIVEKLIASQDEKTKIVIVGCKEEQRQYFGKFDNVIPLGYITDRNRLADIYAAADVFVNLTRADTLPTVNMESICCGTPVITFDCCGSPELVSTECGYVIEEGDCEGLLSRIEDIKRAPLSFDVVKQQRKFDKNECYKKYLSIYKSVRENKK